MKVDVSEQSMKPHGTSERGAGRVMGIYHLNINVSNLERSRRFYEMFGFRVVHTFHEKENANLDRGLGLSPDVKSENRALFMAVGEGRHTTVIDLAEWTHPRSTPVPPPPANEMGIPRFCLRVKHLDDLVSRLRKQGVEFLSDVPQCLESLSTKPRFIICRDPDGVLVEMVELHSTSRKPM